MWPSSPPLFIRWGESGCASTFRLTCIAALFLTLFTKSAVKTSVSACAPQTANARPITGQSMVRVRICTLLGCFFLRRFLRLFLSLLRLASGVADVDQLAEYIEPEGRAQRDRHNG